MNFSELKFKPHENHVDGVRARHDFKNGYGVSVIKTQYSYGGDEGLYELAVMKNGSLCYDSGITDDVMGNMTPSGISDVLVRVEALTTASS